MNYMLRNVIPLFSLLAIGLLIAVRGDATQPRTVAPGRTTTKTENTASEPSFVVKVSGHGQAMILIPGLASAGSTWDTTVAHFKNHYTCYVLTLAGFAGVPPIQRPLLPSVREDLAAYIRRHHLKKPVIVGHSLGGDIALDLAEHDPKLVGPVVIVDSLPFYAGAWFGAKDLAAAKPTIVQMIAGMAKETPAQYAMYAKSGAATKYMVTSPAKLQEIEQWGIVSDMRTVNSAMIELVSEDLRPGLARISSPTLVLGTWSGWAKSLEEQHIHLTRADFVASFQNQYKNLTHLHFVMSDTARHFIMWDDPAWFFQQLDSFLANPIVATRDRGFTTK